MMDIDKVFAHIDANVEAYVEDLREAVAITSVSGNSDTFHRDETIRMVKWAGQR